MRLSPSRQHLGRRVSVGLFCAAVLAGMSVTNLAVPGHAQDSQSVEDLEAERDEVDRLTDEANASLSDLQERIAELSDESTRATDNLAALETRIEDLQANTEAASARLLTLQESIEGGQQRLRERARRLYMDGVPSPTAVLLTAKDFDTGIERVSILDVIAKRDLSRIERSQADRADLQAAVDQVHELRGALVAAQAEWQETTNELATDLEEAQGLEDELANRLGELSERDEAIAAELEAARTALMQRDTGSQAPSPTPAGPGGRACPMHDIPQLFNDWGWPRGGGTRSHKGNDLYGDHREPVYAMASGVWDVQPYGNNAGNWGILRGDDGTQYWYMHLDAHAVGDGTAVSVGDQVAYNGWTGNAAGGVYHVHFEIHPGGGGAVDPYPYLVQVC